MKRLRNTILAIGMAISTISFANTMVINDSFGEPAYKMMGFAKSGWINVHYMGKDPNGDFFLKFNNMREVGSLKIKGRKDIYYPVMINNFVVKRDSYTYSNQEMFVDFSDDDKLFMDMHSEFTILVKYKYADYGHAKELRFVR